MMEEALFQPLSVITLKPVLQRFLEAPLKLVSTVLQLLTTDIRRNLEILHSRRTDAHRHPRIITILSIGMMTQLGISGTN